MDLKTLFQLTLARVRGRTHQERLESFYGAQAENYDSTRRQMLHGREELHRLLSIPPGGVWVELGAGTGSNLEALGGRVRELKQVHLVDLCPSLLRMADDRLRRLGWTNVITHLADATTFTPPEPADVVTFSYSLTMIPEWYAAVDNAARILKPAGVVAVVDYYVSRDHPPPGWVRHGWATRTFGTTLAARNGVRPSTDHLPYLHHRFEAVSFEERMDRVFGPFVQIPYYLFVGRKRSVPVPLHIDGGGTVEGEAVSPAAGGQREQAE